MKASRWRIFVLKLKHRPERDKRLTSHVALTARAFGANGFWVGGLRDPKIGETIRQVSNQWGFQSFEVETGVPWRKKIQSWKQRGGEIVHLTMYGLYVDDKIREIQASPRDKLIIVGGSKVQKEVFELADYNIAIGHQPHSEVAALAIFLDRLFQGEILKQKPNDAKTAIEPSSDGKQVREKMQGEIPKGTTC